MADDKAKGKGKKGRYRAVLGRGRAEYGDDLSGLAALAVQGAAAGGVTWVEDTATKEILWRSKRQKPL